MAEEVVPARMSQAAAQAAPARRGRGAARALTVLVLLALAAAAIGGWYWYVNRNYESTDDAFIDGDAVAISPRVSGIVVKSYITDNQQVKKGDLLLQIDPRDYQARVDSARAGLDAANAQLQSARDALALAEVTTSAAVDEAESGLRVAQANVLQLTAQVAAAQAEAVRTGLDATRYSELLKRNEASRQQVDQATADSHSAAARLDAARKAVNAAEAQVSRAEAQLANARSAPQQLAVKRADVTLREADVEQARAALTQAELDLSYTHIYAAHDGRITKRAVHEGALVQVGQTLALLVYGRPWVTANFKETQLTRMRPGQPVTIEVDAYPGVDFHGHVDSIQSGTGARFSLLPAENATGNYVKVVQRVPVKIVLDGDPHEDRLLALGMSVVPRVQVAGQAADGGTQLGSAAAEAAARQQ